MYRIDNANATSTLPTPLAQGTDTKSNFQSGNPAIGQLATTVDRDWANATQEEFCTVIEAAGITLNKNDHTQLYQALQRLFVTRTKVTTNMTIYVSPTGSDTTGNGLTPGTAFATIQTAINVVYTNYDWNGHVCTIQLADGTYNFTGGASGFQAYFSGMPFGMPAFGLTLQGNPSLPQNVNLNAINASCIMADRALMQVSGLTVTASGIVSTPTAVQGIGVGAQRGGWVQCSTVGAVNCAMAGFRADNGSAIVLSGVNLTLGGAGEFGFFAGLAGEIFYDGFDDQRHRLQCNASRVRVHPGRLRDRCHDLHRQRGGSPLYRAELRRHHNRRRRRQLPAREPCGQRWRGRCLHIGGRIMAQLFNPLNWYWIVGGNGPHIDTPGGDFTGDASRVFASARNGYVPATDATYVTWRDAGQAGERDRPHDADRH